MEEWQDFSLLNEERKQKSCWVIKTDDFRHNAFFLDLQD